MLRHLTMIVTLLLAKQAAAQDWNPQGKIDSREIKIERREGNAVVGTEFVHYEYRVSLRLVDKPDAEAQPVWCDAVCNGKKHKNHQECDKSCDTACNLRHPVKLQGKAVEHRDNMKEMTQTSAQKARAIGMPGGPNNWSSATSSALKQMKAAAKADKLDFDAGHWAMPCTLTDREYGYTVKDVQVRGEFWKVGYYMAGGVRTPINQMVDSHEGTVMTVYKCKRDPVSQGSQVACRCLEVPADPPPPAEKFGRVPTYSGLGWRKPDGTVVIPDEKEVTVACYGKSLTKAEVRIDNKTDKAYEVVIQPGTKLIPDDSGVQIMTCLGNQTVAVAAASTTVFWVSLAPQPLASFEFNVACTEINKKEPSEKTKFKIVAPNDPLLARIAAIEDRGFMRSALAQGRVWIYTDNATREQINKRLLPGLTEGMYLNSLHGMARAGVDLTQPKYKNLLDPALLAGPTATKEATFWFADFLAQQDPKTGYAKKVLDALRTGLASKAESMDARHAGYVAQGLSESDEKAVRMQVLDFMDKSIPEPLKAEFLTEGGLAALLSIGTFGDDEEALKAFAVAKKFPGAETKAMLESFAFFGRESIRTAAEEAAKEM